MLQVNLLIHYYRLRAHHITTSKRLRAHHITASAPSNALLQVNDYVLITLPQAVRYGEGVSGEIRIDVHGNPVEWERSRDSAAFRAKVRLFVLGN